MKLSEIRPCDNCDGKIVPVFKLIEIDTAVFKPSAVNTTLGLNQFFGGNALGLAEVFSPEPDAVKRFSEVEGESSQKDFIFLCQECYCQNICLAHLVEKVTKKEVSCDQTI